MFPGKARSRFSELARVLVRLDHVASGIVNTNHGTARVLKPNRFEKRSIDPKGKFGVEWAI
jgi:hypothetical protein